ncbi:MAG TPA: trehalose-phosphatase [Allosphingosinicella sp.]|nr:trehalose-phosphatase [Allosphingosinicella sp.]
MAILPPPPPDLLDGAALFLDFDGTLVELAETPAAIRVSPGLGPLLERLHERLGGRLAIISGRSVADLERHIACAGIAFSGSHGLELRLADGHSVPLSVPEDLEAMHSAVSGFAAAHEGLLVEEKPAGIALHYRLAPAFAEQAEAFMAALAEAHDMTLQRGQMVVELRPEGATKGDALRSFMTEPVFAGARPVFVGDDLTDEHGFEAAAGLGGAGILVGAERPTAARYRIGTVAAVSDWLEAA